MNEGQLEKKVVDCSVNTIHGGFTSGGETMAAKKRHLQAAKVATIRSSDQSFTNNTDYK